ncbi:hypothetical protein CY35_07G001200 [Sphagnum magellanicum]|uniref:Uncharacterized protein n=1 Tax=Sphagnum magellanicum TaxID=128215 RepID=A0ACB8HIG9_9BRYO|nr:hypothetical protein CY35_07G001200 [Sphagnum magellanicum]
MGTYAIIETGGEQLRVEPGRFYDVRRFTPSKPNLLVLMIRHESMINIGHPWLRGAVVKGRILHSRLGDKTIIYKMRPKKKTRRKSGHRHNSARFVVDSIHLNGEKLHK